MFGRLMVLAWLVPRPRDRESSRGRGGWWAGGAVVLALLALPALAVVAAAGSVSTSAADLRYQCDSAVGPDPSGGVPEPPPLTASPNRAARPSTNPYASLTVSPDSDAVSAWERSCVAAMRTAPYQEQPWGHGNTGAAAGCARELALARVDAQQVAEPAAFTRAVIYGASLAAAAGRCAEPAAVPVDPGAGGAGGAGDADGVDGPGGAGDVGDAGGMGGAGCGRPDAGAAAVLLPESTAAQAGCGQRVHRTAVSAGDLVFWDFRGNAPARAGVAVGSGQLVTVEPGTGHVVWLALPTGADVRVKRVLGGAA